MHRKYTWAFLLTLVATQSGLSAQAIITPLQAVDMEGNSSSGVTFTGAKTRTQQIDRNLKGFGVTSIRSMAFRRSNTASQVGATARTVDLQVDLGFGVASPSSTFDANFKANSRQTVFPSKTFNLPDWTGPTTTPAPFDLVIPFATPFVYSTTESLVWDLRVDMGSGGGSYFMDWMQITPRRTHGDTPEVLGLGCASAPGRFEHGALFSASTNQLMLDWEGTAAPGNTPVWCTVGLSDPNASVGWCAPLRSDVSFLMPPEVSNATGAVFGNVTVTWGAGLAGVKLFTQLIAADASQVSGIALSNGIKTSSPYVKAGGSPGQFQVTRLFDTTGHGPVGSIPTATPVPVLFTIN